MKKPIILISLSFLICSCSNSQTEQKQAPIVKEVIQKKEFSPINEKGRSISTRFNLPFGFERIKTDSSEFGYFLRNLPLKPHGSYVKTYNGGTIDNFGYHAVVDLPIGKKDLHQCADAVMRLRAEYLFEQKRYQDIHFNFTNGMKVEYSEWMKGRRIKVSGNKTSWVSSAQPSNSKSTFWKYLEQVFMYAGTLSLSKELKTKSIPDLEVGDVFIQGGSPGHAIIVVDVAIRPNSNEKLFMLAQSYMPAQEIQILKNPNNSQRGPWYSVEDIGDNLETPDWTFSVDDLKEF